MNKYVQFNDTPVDRRCCYVVVVVELPQTPEDDIRSARTVRGMRTS